MREHEVDLLPNRLNYDAAVFKGCTMNELLLIGAVSIGMTCVFFAIILQIIFGNFLYGVAFGFLVGGALTYCVCAVLERVRRGHEKGYLKQLLKKKLDESGLISSGVIRRNGVWMIGRKIK